MAGLTLKGIKKTYPNGTAVLHGIDLDIVDGDFTVFVGPSGCGKTTLLRMIAGLEDITEGEIYLGDELINDVAPADRGVAMVFQSYALYPHMTIAENMGFALKMAGQSKEEIKNAVGRAAEILQISHLLECKPKTLSGGQRQRVAIGRAIVRKPKVFLFDEPLSNLDASLRVQMRIELAKLHKEIGNTMIYVTHDQVEAMTLGDSIAVFNGGHIEQLGAPRALYDRPDNQFVAGFLGSPRMNIMPCTAEKVGAGMRLQVGDAGAIIINEQLVGALQGKTTLGIRPEHLTLVRVEDGLAAQVDLIEHLGDSLVAYATLRGASQTISLRLTTEQEELAVGQMIGVAPNHPGRVVLFDEKGRTLRN